MKVAHFDFCVDCGLLAEALCFCSECVHYGVIKRDYKK
jgi:hypothetical protein